MEFVWLETFIYLFRLLSIVSGVYGMVQLKYWASGNKDSHHCRQRASYSHVVAGANRLPW